jgi:hypothetical protein
VHDVSGTKTCRDNHYYQTLKQKVQRHTFPLDVCPNCRHIIPNMTTPHASSNFPDPPSYETVAEKLKTLLGIIQEAIAEGTLHVPEYKTWQAEDAIDFALAPNLVRHKAKQFLISSGQDAKDEEEGPGFDTEHIPNNGLCMTTPGYKVRVLKSLDEGGVPLPGTSATRQNFYNQLQALIDFPEFRNGNERVQPTWNLIVHWTVDEKYTLLKLSLALPLHFTRNELGKWIVECAFDEPFWTRSLPKPIQIDEPIPPTVLDIPIEEEPEELTGEEPTEE